MTEQGQTSEQHSSSHEQNQQYTGKELFNSPENMQKGTNLDLRPKSQQSASSGVVTSQDNNSGMRLSPSKADLSPITENQAHDSQQDTKPEDGFDFTVDQEFEEEKGNLAMQVDNIIENGQPIHMIQYDQAQKQFVIGEEAKEFLSRIKERIGVIAVAGMYRTGKSFLLNRVIINTRDQKGFGVGPTINPCTKGLWCWTQLLDTQHQGQPLKCLLIDSEGIGALDEDENHDTKIFLLALLLSSFFIYNSIGTIDENALNNLQLIINLSKELQIKSELMEDTEPEEFAKFFPSFLWIVRDFSLRLLDTYGNAITSKEYLEQSLNLQKGFSDAIEHKNRIRRLIKQVFPDRDCFTMIRPVENEKNLQNLQQMPDSELRPEFVENVTSLRQKIFKKVKPKTLNNKQMTGEMLLELATAYTNAINEGSVPNIQNAWSYVCQNECNRAILESIQIYAEEMKPVIVQAQESLDQGIIKKAHSLIREKCVNLFKEKALGDMTEPEKKLRDGISQRHQKIKAQFTRYCEGKAKEFLEPEIQQVRKRLQEDFYKSMDAVQEEIDNIKQRFITRGPKFNGSQIIFAEMSSMLISKAATYLTIVSRQEVNINQRKLQERIEYLEERAMEDKKESAQVKIKLNTQISELESERGELVKNQKIAEERLKISQEEHANYQNTMKKKTSQQTEELESRIAQLQEEMKERERASKQRDDEAFQKSHEHEKLNALIEQKLEMVEKELREYKTKYQGKDADYKEVNKELVKSRKEVQQLTNQLHSVETSHKDEVHKLKQGYESQLKKAKEELEEAKSAQGAQGGVQVDNSKMDQMFKQFSMMSQQIERMSVAGNPFAGDKQGSESPRSENMMWKEKCEEAEQTNKDLLKTNAHMSEQMVTMSKKQSELEKQIAVNKKLKWMMHYAAGVQCLQCQQLYPKDEFEQHLPECRNAVKRLSSIHAVTVSTPIKIRILEVQKRSESPGSVCNLDCNLDHYIYVMEINSRGECKTVEKDLQGIVDLFTQFEESFPAQINNDLLQLVENDPQKVASEYDTEVLQLVTETFDMICRIPAMRSKAEFKAFFDLGMGVMESTQPTSQDNSLERASMGPFSAFKDRGMHRNNTVKYMTNKALIQSQPKHSFVQDYVQLQQQVVATVDQQRRSTVGGRCSPQPNFSMSMQVVNSKKHLSQEYDEKAYGPVMTNMQTPIKSFPDRISETVSDSQLSSEHRISEVSNVTLGYSQQHMDVKQTPFQTKEEAKRRYVNAASKGSARYEKSHDDFAEMEKAGIQNPFDDYPEQQHADMASFTERVQNDEAEELKVERGGNAKMTTATKMAMTSGSVQKKDEADEEDLIFPTSAPKEGSQARNKQKNERYAVASEDYEESPNSARGSEQEDDSSSFNN